MGEWASVTFASSPLRVEAYAKINWALNIIGRQDNQYHSLDMLMQRIDMCDTLTFEPSDTLSLLADGFPVPCGEDNLIIRAARALQSCTARKVGAKITVNKRIPSRAGLGGGSADCAAVLLTLNEMWDIHLSMGALSILADTMGADVRYLLTGGLARVQGTGDQVHRLDGAKRATLLIAMPDKGLSTKDVFTAWDNGGYSPLAMDLSAVGQALVREEYSSLRSLAGNALYAPACQIVPEIQKWVDRMYLMGAMYAAMSGSGSAVFGVFADDAAALRASTTIPGAWLAHTLSDADESLWRK